MNSVYAGKVDTYPPIFYPYRFHNIQLDMNVKKQKKVHKKVHKKLPNKFEFIFILTG